ncbi:hypothetical protein [Pedobacter gandavensis]|uniref:hypothetical protein n=1 Tax=Pedobacter gandavensis TaxID=2679963 RepID=UPI00292E442A|nr:hypothetical protein [Pedobacter gandavensis]
MAYLNSPRLSFSGKFQADPSTVNNDVEHYDNAKFQPNYQDYGEGTKNGWWNPDGTGNWRLLDCVINSVTYKDGSSTNDPAVDPIIGMSVLDANTRVAGKIVDLDPQQQSVSQIWGMVVRLGQEGNVFVKGDFKPVGFNDIWWNRSVDLTRSPGAAATYQSVLNNLEWSIDGTASRYLQELQAESPDQLSMKFNVDVFNQTVTDAHFTIGRVVGSIGPSNVTEPDHFTLGRQFVPPMTCMGGSYVPTPVTPSDLPLYVATALVREDTKQIVLDLGNCLKTKTADGLMADTRELKLAYRNAQNDFFILGDIAYQAAGWYENNGGLVSISLTDGQLAGALQFPLSIVIQDNLGNTTSLLDEKPNYLRADQFVFRMNDGETQDVDFYATILGKPLVGKTMYCDIQPSLINIMGQGSGIPVTATPTTALTFDNQMVTDATGKVTMSLSASDPKNPRDYIDGQVYALWYYLDGEANTDFSFILPTDPNGNPTVLPAQLSSVDPNNFISVLVFNSLSQDVIQNPQWEDVQPVMQQYANLYPLMSKGIFNLADQTVVDSNAKILNFVFGLPIEDPNHMPVTRDLSRDKQQMILKYLENVIAATALQEAELAENSNQNNA